MDEERFLDLDLGSELLSSIIIFQFLESGRLDDVL
jgi:hypothetical protein